MKKLIVANWKLNPSTQKEAIALAKKIDFSHVVVAPPFPFIEEVGKVLKRAALGAQDAFWEDSGANTGEVSPRMLKSIGVKYVIVGHSERRRILKETDEMVNKKVLNVLEEGMKVILCVGELKRKWQSANSKALKQPQNYIKKQLEQDLRGLDDLRLAICDKLIIAYEPIWSIGTGKNDSPEDALEMITFIKKTLNPIPYTLNSRVLYGGSVASKNIAAYMRYKEIDGALVGGASVRAAEFKKIVEKSNRI